MNLKELQNHIQRTEEANVLGPMFGITLGSVPALKFKDGFVMSVQAGKGLYCEPRTNQGPYTSVEVGYPSEEVPEFMPYVEDHNRPTDTVYSRVPIEIVLDVINQHGELVDGEK